MNFNKKRKISEIIFAFYAIAHKDRIEYWYVCVSVLDRRDFICGKQI